MKRFGESFRARRVALVLLSLLLATTQGHRIGVAQGARPSAMGAGASVTLLPDGRELVIGGVDASGASASVWIRDPRTNAVAEVGRLSRARVWHSATMLPDGRVLIAGGIGNSGKPVQTVERFDIGEQRSEPLSVQWTGRYGHTATLLDARTLLLAGGKGEDGSSSADADILNLQTGVVTSLQPMSTPRANQTASLLADGRVELWGGQDANAQSGSRGAIFDPSSHTFTDSFVQEVESELPSVVTVDPEDRRDGVELQPQLTLRLSRLAQGVSLTPQTISLSSPDGPVAVRIVPAEGGRLAFVTPLAPLQAGTTYSLTTAGVIDRSGLAFPAFQMSFTTIGDQAQGAASADDAVFDPSKNDAWRRWRINRPESPWQHLPALMGPAGVTALSGQALKLNGTPLANVTMRLEGQTVVTDNSGRFLLLDKNLSIGWHTLVIEGQTAGGQGASYGRFDVAVRITPGKTNVLPYTIWMPKIDTKHAVKIASPTTTETVITTPYIPGLELRLPVGTVITDDDGHVVREVSITPIPVDRPPFPLPVGSDVPIYFTIQPGGAYVAVTGTGVHVGARLIYPNYRGLSAGTKVDFWHYQPQMGRGWHPYGTGAASSDGRQVVPDPGTSLYTFTGAMFLFPNILPAWWPRFGNSPSGLGGEPVDLGTGLFVLNNTDLALTDVMPISIDRTYRQNDNASRAFGIGASHAYDMFLVGTVSPYTYVDLVMPDGGRVHYDRISAGTGFSDAVYEHTSSQTAFYKSTIRWSGSDWILDLKNGTRLRFPEASAATRGQQAALTSIRDRYGNQITLTRDSNANLTRIASPNGRYIDLTYDASYRVTQATDNIGRTVQYTYDTGGRLSTVTDPANGVTTYTYDTSNRMLTITDARNVTYLTNQYDSNGRVVLQTLADSSTYQFAYTLDVNNAVTQTDVTDRRGTVRRVTFDAAGYVSSETRALGQPEEQATTYVRQSGTNLVTSMTDALSRQTTYTYDTSGNMTAMTRLAGTGNAVTTTRTYDSTFNQLTSITDPLNHTTSFTYDTAGNVTVVTDPLSHQVTMTYATNGQPTSMTTAAGTTTLTHTNGDLAAITDPLNRTATRFIDAVGRVLSVTSPSGSVTRTVYDALDRLTSVTEPDGGQTTFTYDSNSNVLTLTNALNHATTFTYNSMNRATASTDALSRADVRVYDANGNLQQLTDRKNQVTVYAYDKLNRLKTITYADSSTITYTWDAGNRLTQIADSANGTISRTYDLLDRLTEETTPEGTVGYAYDAAGRRTTMTVSGQSDVSYTYDAADRLTTITQGTAVVGFTYDDANRRTSLTLPNSVVVSYGYDAASQLTSLTYALGATTLGTVTYSYDANGRPTVVGGSWARTGLPAALASASYDAANQIAARAGVSFTHDANGNLTNDGSQTYTWNARNQLSSVSASGSTTTFSYDGVGRRRARASGGTTTTLLYDGGNLVQEQVDGTASANLLTGLAVDETLVRTDAAGMRAFLADAIGSTLALTNASGAVLTEYSFDPFGATTVSGTSSANPMQFAGRENDGTGLYALRARYYSPQLQRFLSEDPIGFAGEDVNQYAYVGNSPIGFIDPEGLQRVNSPRIGTPNGKMTIPDGKGGHTDRYFGPDGKATHDVDYGHDHGKGDPHTHPWQQDPPKRLPGDRLKPFDIPWLPLRIPFPLPLTLNPCLIDPWICQPPAGQCIEA